MENKKDEHCGVSDQVAKKVLEMAKRFYSNPENVKAYEAWHLKEYGCLPKKSK